MEMDFILRTLHTAHQLYPQMKWHVAGLRRRPIRCRQKPGKLLRQRTEEALRTTKILYFPRSTQLSGLACRCGKDVAVKDGCVQVSMNTIAPALDAILFYYNCCSLRTDLAFGIFLVLKIILVHTAASLLTHPACGCCDVQGMQRDVVNKNVGARIPIHTHIYV